MSDVGDRLAAAAAAFAVIGFVADIAGAAPAAAAGFAGVGLLLLGTCLAVRMQNRRARGLTPVSYEAVGVSFAVVIVVLFAIILILAGRYDDWSALAGLGR